MASPTGYASFDSGKRRIYVETMRSWLILCIALFAAAYPAGAAENGAHYIGATYGADVHASPVSGSKVITHLDRLTDVTVLQRIRGWAEIETSRPSVRGWVIEGTVRQRYQPSTAQKARSSFFASFARMFGGNEPQQQTAVLGVRGLEEGNATGTASNPQAVRWMESLHVSQQEVDRFIRDGRLNP